MAIFKTHCTLPAEGAGIVYSPDVRRTLNILWSCLSILILCTWNIQHLNVPVQARPATKWQALGRKTYMIFRKLAWMLLTLVAPEAIFGKAFADHLSAKYNKESMKNLASEDGIEWTLAHAFFANMGAFELHFPQDLKPPAAPHKEIQSNDKVAICEGNVVHSSHPELLAPHCHAREAQSAGIPEDPLESGDARLRNLETRPQEGAGVLSTFSQPDCGNAKTQTEDVVGVVSVGKLVSSPQKHSSPTASFHSPLTRLESDLIVSSTLPMGAPSANTILMRKEFDKRKCSSRRGIDAMQRANQKLSRLTGEICWPINDHNRKLVLEAIDLVKWEDIPRVRYVSWFESVLLLQGDSWILDAPQLLLARDRGIISKLPSLSKDDLEDRSKGDFLIKALAVLQIIWLWIQLITRAVEHLPVTQLEVVVLAFSICAVVTYGLLWSKPQDVKTHFRVTAAGYPTARDLIDLGNMAPVVMGNHRRRQGISNRALHRSGDVNPFSIVALGGAVGALLFGLLHCIAWRFTFPTFVERSLWRTSSVISVVMPMLALPMNFFYWNFVAPLIRNRGEIRTPAFIGVGMGIFFVVPYVLARLFITVEVFRSLEFLPPLAFKTTWSSNFPHLS